MTAVNQILPVGLGAGANVEIPSVYAVDPLLTIGNQPGVARSNFTNTALRQSTYMAYCLAQYILNLTGNSVLDDGNGSEVLANMQIAFARPPIVTTHLSGSGTHTLTASPSYIRVRMMGGGGGGGASSTNVTGNPGTAGNNTTFGTSLLVAGGGQGGAIGGSFSGATGGTASLGTGPTGLAIVGGTGNGGGTGAASGVSLPGGNGGNGPFGGGGVTQAGIGGTSGATNSGGGGGGGGAPNNGYSGNGGGAGGYVEAYITGTVLATILASGAAFSVGTGGTGGSLGSGGEAGGNGGSGMIIIEEHYQ